MPRLWLIFLKSKVSESEVPVGKIYFATPGACCAAMMMPLIRAPAASNSGIKAKPTVNAVMMSFSATLTVWTGSMVSMMVCNSLVTVL